MNGRCQSLLCVSLAFALMAPGARAETNQEHARRVIDDAVAVLGGDRFLHLHELVQSGRAFSFYREQVSGLSIATIHTRYLSNIQDTANNLAVVEREFFGKKEDFGVLFLQSEAYDVSYRGARPLTEERFARYKETTLRDVLYILRVRLNEPGMILESRGADVLDNRPVEIVDITDAQNRTTTAYFDQIEKYPVRQIFYRRDPVNHYRDEEISTYTKYRSLDGVLVPFDVHRERNGEKIYEMFSDSGQINKGEPDKLFELPSGMKMLKPQ